VLFEPTRLFRAMRAHGLGPAISIQYVVAAALLLVALAVGGALAPELLAPVALWGGVLAVAAPWLMFVQAGLLHANMRLVGSRRPYVSTYRCCAYLEAGLAVWLVVLLPLTLFRIPLLSPLVMAVFTVHVSCVSVLAVRETHRIDTGRVVLAHILHGVEAFFLQRFWSWAGLGL
jgi:hypothetical protein